MCTPLTRSISPLAPLCVHKALA
uniref:Uncharacterized protein n=1 Tax=Anguilla anguilla TaxID=7936 RepID=A0A0E9PYV3_ANGAN